MQFQALISLNRHAALRAGHCILRKLTPGPEKQSFKVSQPRSARSGLEPGSLGGPCAAKGRLPSPFPTSLRRPVPRGLGLRGGPQSQLPRPGSPSPTCRCTRTPGGAALAYKVAAPSAGGSGRPPAPRTPWRPAHLQRPLGLQGNRKPAARGAGRPAPLPLPLPLPLDGDRPRYHEPLQVRG